MHTRRRRARCATALIQPANIPGDCRRLLYQSLGAGAAEAEAGLDAVVGALGRAAFFPRFAVFPVLYLDGADGVAVFRFPPLSSNIAVRRLA
jgi:hypothetical protein